MELIGVQTSLGNHSVITRNPLVRNMGIKKQFRHIVSKSDKLICDPVPLPTSSLSYCLLIRIILFYFQLTSILACYYYVLRDCGGVVKQKGVGCLYYFYSLYHSLTYLLTYSLLTYSLTHSLSTGPSYPCIILNQSPETPGP
jgi:hypothetical protein